MTHAAVRSAALFSGPAPRILAARPGDPVLARIVADLRLWSDAAGDPLALGRARIWTPTRRSARAAREAFEDALAPAAGLVAPRIGTLADMEGRAEGGVQGEGESLVRRLALARFIRAFDDMGAGAAFAAAGSLGALLDQVALEEANVTGLADLDLEARFPEHWARLKRFLDVVFEAWPRYAAERGHEDAALRRAAAERARAEEWTRDPPTAPVIIAGSTGAAPATRALMKAVAQAPLGVVILPGLDLAMDEGDWRATQEGHTQHLLRVTLEDLGVERADVRPLTAAKDAAPGRDRLLAAALRPAEAATDWRAAASLDSEGPARDALAAAAEGLHYLEARDEADEARLIACALLDMARDETARIALVTPDQGLVRRVRAALARAGADMDVSAGRPLAETAFGGFALRVARAAEDPGDVLAALDLMTSGFIAPPADWTHARRERARLRLEKAALRGVGDPDGPAAWARRLDEGEDNADARAFLAAYETALAPFRKHVATGGDLAAIAQAHRAATLAFMGAPALNDRDPAVGAFEETIAAFIRGAPDAGGMAPGAYPALFAAAAAERAVYERAWEARIQALGPREARLVPLDAVVLGGLNEATWPAGPGVDPWMNRAMRAAVRLPPPERRVGLAAHDFLMATGAPLCLLTRAAKAEGAPARPSRWLARLAALFDAGGLARDGAGVGEGLSAKLAAALESDWTRRLRVQARAWDAPVRAAPAARPAVRVPPERFPKTLSATDLERLARDPYGLYAKKVLGLRPLEAFAKPFGPGERGSAVHKALEDESAQRNAAALARAIDTAMARAGAGADLVAAWGARHRRLAEAFVAWADGRRVLGLEDKGAVRLGPIEVTVRADRIDEDAAGVHVIDHKTGRIPTKKEVESGFALQLQIAGLALAAGGFERTPARTPTGLLYLGVKGARDGALEPLRIAQGVDGVTAALDAARERIVAALTDFRAGAEFVSRVAPRKESDALDYDHLARAAEWAEGAAEEDA